MDSINSNLSNSSLSLSDYDFHLPKELIAQQPAKPRDSSRLLVINRDTGRLKDSRFLDLSQHLRQSDLLVVNNARVMKARVIGKHQPSQREVEIFFANPISEQSCEVLLNPGRKVREGDIIEIGQNIFLTAGSQGEHGLRVVNLKAPPEWRLVDILARYGRVPLPPYINREVTDQDEVDYQTVYSQSVGAVAAPTAGLHFSKKMLASLQKQGIELVELTLHVGLGTFLPVRTSDPGKHKLKAERYEITNDTADALNNAMSAGRRIVAVGTTTTRTLEYVYRNHGRFAAEKGEADLYILPGYRFEAVKGILTNFHLPRTTLLLLAAAFSSRNTLLKAYRHAIGKRYRFYSYGDCTLFI